jgi:hypothetical protein
MSEAMEDSTKFIDSLIEKSVEYGKISYELVRLKALDKTSDVISSLIPSSIVFVLIASFMLFLNLGIAFWLGVMLGKTFYGFFIVAAFYALIAIILHFFIYKWIKKLVGNYIIKKALK